MLLAVNSGGLRAETHLPGFPTPLDRRVRARRPVHPGRALRDDERRHRPRARHPDRLPEPALADADARRRAARRPARRHDRRSGSFQAVVYIAVGLDRRRPLRLRPRSACSCCSPSTPSSRSRSARSALFAALRTGSGEAVQGLFPLFFVFLFISSMAIPRNLMSVTWFRDVATVNPVSYLIEGVRSLIVIGWDGEALALGFAIADRRSPSIAIASRRGRCARGWRARESGSRSRRASPGGAAQLLPQPVAADPVGRSSRCSSSRRSRAGSRGSHTRPASTTRAGLHRVPVRLRDAPVGGVRRRLHRLRDRARLRERLRTAAAARGPAPQRDRARLRDRRARALDRHRVASSPSVAFAVRMKVGGSGVDLSALYVLGIIVNFAATLWAAGVAMRLRTMQAGPDHADAGLPDPLLRAGLRPARAAPGLDPRRRGRQPDDAGPRGRPRLRRRLADPGARRVHRRRVVLGAALLRSGRSAACGTPKRPASARDTPCGDPRPRGGPLPCPAARSGPSRGRSRGRRSRAPCSRSARRRASRLRPRAPA